MSWRDEAACRGVWSGVFFPGTWSPEACRPARAICASCPVQEPCLTEALQDRANDDGIRASTTPRQRRTLRGGLQACVECEALFVGYGSRLTCSPECSHLRHSRSKHESRVRVA